MHLTAFGQYNSLAYEKPCTLVSEITAFHGKVP